MKTIVLMICVMVAIVSLTKADEEVESRWCISNRQCRSGCCIRNRCTDSRWCPCSHVRNPCRPNQRCVSQDVLCVRAPCYPIPRCIN